MKPVQRQIAFLRAINVGGHTVKMDRLRALFGELAFDNVATFIASGNVIFDAPAAGSAVLETQIEGHLRESLGYAVVTFLRTPAELAAVASYTPFAPDELAAEGHSLYVAFLKALPNEEAQRKLLALRNEIDDFQFHGRELYWLARARLTDSPLFSGALLEKTIGMPATMRNITTVRKLALKYPPL
jgi:uncharacterized protein (DUF1697 family)